MAPDLNPVPTSPRSAPTSQPSQSGSGVVSITTPAPHSRQSSTPASRRASQIYPMSPPPLPLASPSGSVPMSSHQSSQHTTAFPPLSPSLAGHVSNVDAAGVPMRHPRPLTAAELHLELEKEQEAVVNRLTRELSALRAHSASVASTASSATSGAFLDAPESLSHGGSIVGPTHPTASRRHRSSSSVSRTSMNAPYGGPTSFATGATGLPHRYSISSQPAINDPSTSANPQIARSTSVVSTPRYEEVAHYRQELEEAKRENDALKRRIRELERMIRGADDGNSQRGRSGAPSTNEDTATNGAENGNDAT